jgi:hypothetical protein
MFRETARQSAETTVYPRGRARRDRFVESQVEASPDHAGREHE